MGRSRSASQSRTTQQDIIRTTLEKATIGATISFRWRCIDPRGVDETSDWVTWIGTVTHINGSEEGRENMIVRYDPEKSPQLQIEEQQWPPKDEQVIVEMENIHIVPKRQTATMRQTRAIVPPQPEPPQRTRCTEYIDVDATPALPAATKQPRDTQEESAEKTHRTEAPDISARQLIELARTGKLKEERRLLPNLYAEIIHDEDERALDLGYWMAAQEKAQTSKDPVEIQLIPAQFQVALDTYEKMWHIENPRATQESWQRLAASRRQLVATVRTRTLSMLRSKDDWELLFEFLHRYLQDIATIKQGPRRGAILADQLRTDFRSGKIAAASRVRSFFRPRRTGGPPGQEPSDKNQPNKQERTCYKCGAPGWRIGHRCQEKN